MRKARILACVLVALSWIGPCEQTGAQTGQAGEPRYHVRLLRVRWDAGIPGSALFRPDQAGTVVSMPDLESWGSEEQIEALRQVLAASDVEAIPGLIIRTGLGSDGLPFHFRTALGTDLVDVDFTGEPRRDGWHGVWVSATSEIQGEILDARVLTRAGGTVALVAPLPEAHEALVIGVTPLSGPEAPVVEIAIAGVDGVTTPRLMEKVEPVYPVEDRQSGMQGKIMLQAVIRADGRPSHIVVVNMPEGGERLAGAAVEAVERWRYEPARRDGNPVDAYFTIFMSFTVH